MSWDWSEIENTFEHTLCRNGLHPEQARLLSRAIANDLAHQVSGGQPYIPQRADRREDVRSLFNGHNYGELAQLFGVTPRTIRRWMESE